MRTIFFGRGLHLHRLSAGRCRRVLRQYRAGTISLFRVRPAAAVAGRRIQQPSPASRIALMTRVKAPTPMGTGFGRARALIAALGNGYGYVCLTWMILALRKMQERGQSAVKTNAASSFYCGGCCQSRNSIVDGPRFGAEEYNQPQPIGQIRIACKICARIGCG
jgi:hypothetical protein